MELFQASHTGLPSIVSNPVPAGVPYRVTGAADGVEWLVAEGVGSGAVVAVSDPAAPVDVLTTYTVTAGASVSAVFTRGLDAPFGVDTVVSALDGRESVAAVWEGDAAMSWSPGLSFAQPLARRLPVVSRPLRAGGPSWALEFRVDLDEVAAARRVLESGVVWVAHARERCDGGSTLPRVMLAGVDGDVSESRWSLGRTYSVKLRELETGVSGVPVVTWGEAKRAGVAWGAGTSFASVRAQIAGA